MWPLAAYLLLMLLYLPGLWIVLQSRTAGRLPLVTFCFLGQFLFNAVGSWHVMQKIIPDRYSDLSEIYPTSLASPAFAGLLVLQVVLFYAVAGPYWWWKSKQFAATASCSPLPRLPDRCFPWLAVLAIAGTLTAWVATGGRLLIDDLLAGRINNDNILEFRAATYGRPDFWLYLIGLRLVPTVLFAFVVLTALGRQTFRWRDGLLAAGCFVPQLMLAEKAGILYLAAAGLIAATMAFATRGGRLLQLISPRTCLLMVLAFVPTVTTYVMYSGRSQRSVSSIAGKLSWRIAGVYSESLAAVVPMKNYFGPLHGASLPTIHGLLPHHRMNLERAMHEFLWHGRLQPEREGLAGATPVSVAGEGYLNFGWLGAAGFVVLSLLIVTAMQEFLLRLPQGAMIQAMAAHQAWLCASLWTIGLFSTLVSLVYTALLLTGIAGWFMLAGTEQLLKKRRTTATESESSESAEPPARRLAA